MSVGCERDERAPVVAWARPALLLALALMGCSTPGEPTGQALRPLHEWVSMQDDPGPVSDAAEDSEGDQVMAPMIAPAGDGDGDSVAGALADPGAAEAQDAEVTDQAADAGTTPIDGAPGDGTPVDGTSASEPGGFSKLLGGLDVSGSLSTRVRYRGGNGDKDGDFYSVLSLQVNDPDEDAYSGYFLGRVANDFMGGTSSDDSFYSLNDTWAGSWNFRIYEAYVDANQIDGLEKLRIGRQALYDAPEYLAFDGAMAITAPDENGTKMGVYAGLPFRAYQSGRSGNKLAGTWLETQPWRGGRVRFDYLYLKDELQVSDEQNNFMALSFWQAFDNYLRVRGNYSQVEGRSRDAEIAATYYDPDLDLTVQALYKELLTTQRLLATEIDPLYETLVQYEPYRHGRLIVGKGLGDNWLLEGGLEIRRLKNDGDEGTYNREFERYHVTTIASDLVAEDVDVSLTGELWTGDDSNDYATWGFDVTKEASEQVRLSGGMVYAKWKNDFLLDEEREDVWTYYTRVRYKATENTTWAFGYDFEDSELDNFHTVTARMTWRF